MLYLIDPLFGKEGYGEILLILKLPHFTERILLIGFTYEFLSKREGGGSYSTTSHHVFQVPLY
jgi:hypothetical protein